MRATAAWTVELSESVTCDSGTPGSGDGGYVRHYSYSPDSRIEYRTEAVDPTEADRIEYSYPSGDDPDQPHASTAVGSDSHSWDANGNLVSRTVDGTSETFTWDAEQRLVSVDGPGSGFYFDPTDVVGAVGLSASGVGVRRSCYSATPGSARQGNQKSHLVLYGDSGASSWMRVILILLVLY